jgi:hypothetical protein
VDPVQQYPDPFGEALSYSAQRAAQMASMAATVTQVVAYRNMLRRARQAAQREQELRAVHEQERAAYQQASAGWAPALDQRWLAQADMMQAAGTWGAAAPYADSDPAAASALLRSEERLRVLHPYAMAFYDRLRSQGASPLDAMRQAAPLFAREPNPRRGQPGPDRRSLTTSAVPADPVREAPPGGTALRPDPGQERDRQAEHRGRQIAERLQARAYRERGAELSPDELATALDATTSLPAEVIGRLARADSEQRAASGAERARADDLDHAAAARSARELGEGLTAARHDTAAADTAAAQASAGRTAAQLAAESFPCTAADGIRAAVTGSLRQPMRPPTHSAAIHSTRRLGPSG